VEGFAGRVGVPRPALPTPNVELAIPTLTTPAFAPADRCSPPRALPRRPKGHALAGHERFAKAFPAATRLGEELFSVLTDEELTALRTVTSKLRESALRRLGVSLEGL
jgi:hypothetical protein